MFTHRNTIAPTGLTVAEHFVRKEGKRERERENADQHQDVSPVNHAT